MNRRYIVWAIAAVVIVVGVLVGVSLANRGGSSTPTRFVGADKVKAEFAGLDQKGATIGKATAPVEIIEYGDTSCPICRDASKTVVPKVIDRWVRTGKAKMTFSPVAFISPSSERGALGAEASALQNAMWPYVTLLYANQGPEQQDWLTNEAATEAAKTLGLDMGQWQPNFTQPSEVVSSSYLKSMDRWQATGSTATPTFEIVGPKGTQVFTGLQGISKFEEAISKVGG